MLASRQPDFPYCLCWANENWTRRWDSSENEVLIAQQFRDGDDLAFIRSVLPHFADPRYVKVDGRPVLLVYRTDIIPNIAAVAAVWRAEARRAGHPDLYLVRCNTFVPYGLQQDPAAIGFDAVVEYPPHAVSFAQPGVDDHSERHAVHRPCPRLPRHRRQCRQAAEARAHFPADGLSCPGTTRHAAAPRPGRPPLQPVAVPRLAARDDPDFTLTHYRGDERLVFINA